MRDRRTFGVAPGIWLALVLALMLAGGCVQSKASGPPPKTVIGGPSSAQLAALRSVPTSQPLTGPRVPELFSLEDARNLTGLQDIRITAQTG
jgi:hypothetical protein